MKKTTTTTDNIISFVPPVNQNTTINEQEVNIPIDIDLLRILKQRFEQGTRDVEKIRHIAGISIAVRALPDTVFTNEEKHSLCDLLDQWLRGVVPAYDGVRLEMEADDEEE